MEKKKIYFIIFFGILLLFILIYFCFFHKTIDRNAYLELISGEATLNEKHLEIAKREKLNKNDIVETLTPESFLVIEWGDGSVTRLGGNTKIQINDYYVSKNKDKINILFNLFSGKTWSNVTSYMGEDSYFKQIFSDTEVAVRGTIYTVDLDFDYLHSANHDVTLKNEKYGEVKVEENKTIRLSDFSFIFLDDFIKSFKDKNFFDLNQKFDKELFEKMLAYLEENSKKFVSYLDDTTKDARNFVYAEALQIYQDLHFVTGEMSETLFNLKLKAKENLINNSTETEKKNLLQTVYYDLEDIFETKSFGNFETITNIFQNNEKYLNLDETYNYLKKFDEKFEIGATFNKTLDIFKSDVLNNPNYAKFFEMAKNSIKDTIIENKGFFQKIWDYIKNIF